MDRFLFRMVLFVNEVKETKTGTFFLKKNIVFKFKKEMVVLTFLFVVSLTKEGRFDFNYN